MSQRLTASPAIASTPSTRRAPGPSSLGSLNCGVGFVRDPFALLHDTTERYGPIVRFGVGKGCLHLLHHPEHVQHVLIDNNRNYEKSSPFGMMKFIFGRGLLFNEGPSWFSQRRLMQPSFQPKQFSALSQGIADVIGAKVQSWPREAQETDIEEDMVLLSRGIIGKLLFGTELSRDLEIVLDSTGGKIHFFLGNLPCTPQSLAYKAVMRRVNKAVYGIIAQRRGQEDKGNDMLGILMNAVDKDTGKGMDDTQLRDEIVTLLFSGFDTTSRTLSWVFHSLAENPHVEAALHEELEQVLEGRAPTPADLPNLTYTQMLIKETMRVFPANPIIGRRAKADDEIGGYHIPAGSFLTISPYLAQRNQEFWDEPQKFDPLRFSPEREKEIGKFDYFPFGGGPRQCIGKGIAMMTIPLAIATIAQNFRFASKADFAVEHDIKVVTFQSRRGIRAVRHLRPA
jgi:cytochrome P450